MRGADQAVKIHPSAIVHPAAEIGEGVEIGPFCTIGEHVRLGARTRLVSHVVVDGWTTLGEDNVVYPFAVLGLAPQDRRYKGERAFVTIGHRNEIREYVSIHRASDPEGATVVGDGNLIMGYVHVAHNCTLGNHVTIADYVGLAGHVTIEDQANLGGQCGIHQFVRVGRLSMVGGQARVVKDVPPFALVAGDPVRLHGPNVLGLRRRGMDQKVRSALDQAFKLLKDSRLNRRQAVAAIRSEIPLFDEVEHLLRFLEAPSRMGVITRPEGVETARSAPPRREEAPSNGRVYERQEAGV